MDRRTDTAYKLLRVKSQISLKETMTAYLQTVFLELAAFIFPSAVSNLTLNLLSWLQHRKL